MKKKSPKKKSTAMVKLENQIKEMESVIQDLTDTKNLTLVSSPFAKNQLMRILQRTPKKYIKQRKGRGGKMFDYVPGVYLKKCANYTFGWLWSTDSLREKEYFDKEERLITVCSLVKLTVYEYDKKNGRRELIHKTCWGKAHVKYLKSDSFAMVDVGDDWKASVTDGIKKCLSEMGFASDVYGKNEFKEIQEEEKEPKDVTPRKKVNGADEVLNDLISKLNVENNFNRAMLQKVIKKHFNKDYTTDLTQEEKAKLIKILNNILTGGKNGSQK